MELVVVVAVVLVDEMMLVAVAVALVVVDADVAEIQSVLLAYTVVVDHYSLFEDILVYCSSEGNLG